MHDEPGLTGATPLSDGDIVAKRYKILSELGRGGYAIVYKAEDLKTGQVVAIKTIRPIAPRPKEVVARFRREAELVGQLKHPNTVRIFDYGFETDFFMAMEYLQGYAVSDILDGTHGIPAKRALAIARGILESLTEAHGMGIVHRDLKPENIYLVHGPDGSERVKVLDFGIAKSVYDEPSESSLTLRGRAMGTPTYMSPEQAGGEPIDLRSDLFSLGSVLYAMCTGRPPFRAETTFGILRRIRESEPRAIREVNPDIPEWFERVVRNLLSKSPDDRLDSASALSTLLEQCLAHVQQPTAFALPDHVLVNTPTNVALKRRSLVAACLLLFVATMLTVACIVVIWHQERDLGQPGDSTSVSSAIEPSWDWNATQFEL
jgi:serine/threonine protein kinase